MDAINMAVLAKLQEYAQLYFSAIVGLHTVDGRCSLKPGKYTAKELADSNKAACGLYVLPQDQMFDEQITITAGTFNCEFPYRRIFAILAQWEAISKARKQKAVFEIGEVEERSAKILVDEKTALGAYATKGMKVQRVTGNWWMPRKLPKNGDVALFYELNGVMFVPGLTFFVDRIKKERKSVVERCAGIGDEEIKKLFLSFLAKNPDSSAFGYFAEVARHVNLDTQSEEAAAIMEAAREEKRKREEENARREAEEAECRRIAKEETRKQAEEEEREAAESLAKAKEKFIAGKMLSRNDFERIAESIGYEINIRTIGTLRKRVEWIEVETDGTPTVYGTKRRAGLEGTFAVIREVHAIVKAQIPESEEPIKHISEIMETCRTWDDEKRDYTDEYKYYTWLANHIPEHKATNKNITELILEEVRERISAAATLAAHGVPKCDIEGAVCAVVNRLAKMEDILQFHIRTEPSQSPETPQTVECTADTPNPRETARKRQNRGIGNTRTTQRRTIKRFLIVQSVPRLAKCSTAHHIAGASKMVYSGIIPSGYAPPIRGDCKLSISTRAKPPNWASCEKINILQPP